MRIENIGSPPLAANAVFTSDWINNSLSGAPGAGAGQFVRVTTYSDVPGRLAIQQCDDTSVVKLLAPVAQIPTSGGAAAQLEAAVTAQSWRIVYTNGATAQTKFQIIAASTSDLAPAILAELRRINLQLMGMRGPRDSSANDPY